MNLTDTIKGELKDAMKGKDGLRLLVLRMLVSSFDSKVKEKRYELSKQGKEGAELDALSQLTDEEAMSAVSFEAKKRRESAAAFEKGGRQDLVEKEREELKVLEAYLPSQMTEQEVASEVSGAIEAVGASGPQDMGKVMAYLMGRVKGKADGALVNRIVQEQLR